MIFIRRGLENPATLKFFRRISISYMWTKTKKNQYFAKPEQKGANSHSNRFKFQPEKFWFGFLWKKFGNQAFLAAPKVCLFEVFYLGAQGLENTSI